MTIMGFQDAQKVFQESANFSFGTVSDLKIVSYSYTNLIQVFLTTIPTYLMGYDLFHSVFSEEPSKTMAWLFTRSPGNFSPRIGFSRVTNI